MPTKSQNARERGIALVIVLGGLAVITVMAGHMTSTSQVTALEAKVLTARSKLKYAAESAAAHSYWMWLAHRERFPARHRQLGSGDSVLSTIADVEKWYADGSTHELDRDGFKVEVKLLDAKRGINLYRGNAEKFVQDQFTDELNAEEMQEKRVFLHALKDYRDNNDLPRLHGKEAADYQEDGYNLMPRNADLEFRSEIYWLPHTSSVIPQPSQTGTDTIEALQILPPEGRGRKFLRSSGKSSFFSSSAATIQRTLNLSEHQLERVLKARQAVYKENLPLRDAVPADLYTRIRQNFSLGESGFVTIKAVARSEDGVDVRRQLILTREPKPANLHHSKGDLISNWQKMVY